MTELLKESETYKKKLLTHLRNVFTRISTQLTDKDGNNSVEEKIIINKDLTYDKLEAIIEKTRKDLGDIAYCIRLTFPKTNDILLHSFRYEGVTQR